MLKVWTVFSVHVFVAGLANRFYGFCALGFGVIYNPKREVFLGGP